jgi:endoglucanase
MGGVRDDSKQLVAGNHTATFRLLIDHSRADNSRILSLDIYDAAAKNVLMSLDVTRKMFDHAGQYQDFDLDFKAVPGQRLEFRTYFWGGAYVKQDAVSIR